VIDPAAAEAGAVGETRHDTHQPGRDASGATLVPGWLRGASNLFAMLVTAVLVGISLWLVGWASPVLAPLGLGLFLAAIAAPMFVWLEQRTRSPGLALAVTIGLLIVVGAAIVWLLLASARALADSLATYADELQARYAALPVDSAGAPASLRDLVPPEILVAALRAAVDVATEVGGNVAFAVVLAALLLLDGRRLTHLVADGLGSANPVFREAPALARTAVTYVLVRVRVNVVTAAGLLVLMVVLGVDYPLLWAVGAFFLSFVPYLGLTIALIAPTILAFAESGPVAAAIMVIGGIVLNLVAENVLEPTLTGRALSLATWIVFTMFFFWVWLIGPVGALLSMPITVLLVMVLEHDEQTRWVATLLQSRDRRPGSEA
jgi:AI-2 transport protein TqsA